MREARPIREQWPRSGAAFALVAFAGALVVFLAQVGRDALLFQDEIHSLTNLHRGYGFLAAEYDSRGSGLAWPLLQLLSADLFGAGLWAYRLPALLGSLGAVLLLYPAACRLVGRTPALIAVLALATNSQHVYYSHFGRAYSLAVFLGLLTVHSLNSALEGERPRARHYLMLSLALGLMTYVHLVSIGFAAGVVVAGLLEMRMLGKTRSHGRWMLGSLGAGLLLAVLLHLPAGAAIRDFLGSAVGPGAATFVQDAGFHAITLEILTGSPTAGWVWIACLPLALTLILVKLRSASFLLIAGPLATVALVFVLSPRGPPFAFARYLLIATPFFLMWLAWLLVELVRRVPMPVRARDPVALVLGFVLVAVSFAASPLGIAHVDDGPFANGYLSLRRQPAFDIPWEQTPEFYRTLAQAPDSVKIIEVPELRNGRVFLYRNYYLQHGKSVMFGMIDSSGDEARLPRGPYVSLRDMQALRDSGAQFLVVHLDVERESTEHKRFVDGLGVVPEPVRLVDASGRLPSKMHLAVALLRERLGKPEYEDGVLVVWRLDPDPD